MRFAFMSFFTGGFFLVELIVGVAIGSLSLQADAFHMASDLAALGIGFLAARMSKKKATVGVTYGYHSIEVIGALVNSVFLLSVCFIVGLESLHRFGCVWLTCCCCCCCCWCCHCRVHCRSYCCALLVQAESWKKLRRRWASH
jgi:hypothetical protein